MAGTIESTHDPWLTHALAEEPHPATPHENGDQPCRPAVRGSGAVGERCGLSTLAAILSTWPSDPAYATDLSPVRATRRPIPATGKAGYTPRSRTFFGRNAAVFIIRVCFPKGAAKSCFGGDSNVDSLTNMRLEGKRMVSGHTGNVHPIDVPLERPGVVGFVRTDAKPAWRPALNPPHALDPPPSR